MSYGLVICSTCGHEVHQDASRWYHCDDGTLRCPGAISKYPRVREEIVGRYCGRDDLDNEWPAWEPSA